MLKQEVKNIDIIGTISINIRKFFNSTLDVSVYVFLGLVLLVTAYPFWYVLVYSFSDPSKITSGFLLYPVQFTLEAYSSIFQSDKIIAAFIVSVARSTIGPILSGLITMMAAYVLSHRELPGRRFLSILFILTMYFGAGLIPYYLLIKSLGLINNFMVYIIPSLTNVFGMILMRTYIESQPLALEESALIDGANDLVIFFRITLPLSVPVIAAVVLFSCVGQWNSYTDTLIYCSTNEKLYSLQYVLVVLVSSVSASQNINTMNDMIQNAGRVKLTPMAIRMAITIVAIIPISLVYPFLQRYFIKGMLIGAVKG